MYGLGVAVVQKVSAFMGADQKATYSNNSYNSFNFSENYEIDLNNYTWQIMYNSPLDDIHQVLKKIGDKPIR